MTTTGAELVGRALVAGGVEHLFGVHGYINPAVEAACRQGARAYHFRHEQSAGFAADAYARLARRPGVCFASASAGHANYLSALSQAYGALSPVVLLVGQHGTAGDRLHILQEGYATENLASVTKWSHRVVDPAMNAHWVARALRESHLYPPGPVVLELPLDNLAGVAHSAPKWLPAERTPAVPRTAADPADVDRAVDRFLAARRPLLIAGDGVHWADGGASLRRLARLLAVPAGARRTARGAMPEHDELAHTAAARPPLLRETDLICLVGLRASELEGWFEPPEWPVDAEYIQINERPEELWYGLPSSVTLAGSSGLVLEQLADAAEVRLAAGAGRDAWLEERGRPAWLARTAEARATASARLRERADAAPPDGYDVSTAQLSGAIAEVMDPDTTVVFDSYTGSLYLTDAVEARHSGQILDAGPRVALGQGIGMCAGAVLARPDAPVVTLVGDGGFGISAPDLETLVRYDLPAVVVIHNNASWGGRSLRQDLFHPDLDPWTTSPDVSYADLAAALGCHAEAVVKRDELCGALERAFAAGRPAVVDVRADDGADVVSPPWMRLKITDLYARGLDAYPDEALAMFRNLSPRAAVRLRKSCRDNGLHVPLEFISDLTGLAVDDLAAVPDGW